MSAPFFPDASFLGVTVVDLCASRGMTPISRSWSILLCHTLDMRIKRTGEETPEEAEPVPVVFCWSSWKIAGYWPP
jgi:hypothetical protein